MTRSANRLGFTPSSPQLLYILQDQTPDRRALHIPVFKQPVGPLVVPTSGSYCSGDALGSGLDSGSSGLSYELHIA